MGFCKNDFYNRECLKRMKNGELDKQSRDCDLGECNRPEPPKNQNWYENWYDMKKQANKQYKKLMKSYERARNAIGGRRG